jgi:hypothetical protein
LEDKAKAPKLLLLCPSGVLCKELFTKSQRETFAQISIIILDLLLAEEGSENKYIMWSYCPPKDGGQFNITDTCIVMFPRIAELIVLLMDLAILSDKEEVNIQRNRPR